jgi:serine/threonine protein kinase
MHSAAPAPAPAPAPVGVIGPGVVVDGRFRLDALLGSGGFGSVYRARHLRLDADVAIKIVHPHLVGSGSVLRRFELEAISTCRVRHPHAVQVLDAGTAQGGLPYLVMELLTGPTLAEELEGLERLSLRRAAEILLPICHVLEEAHRVGIVHRDVKPANVVLADGPQGELVKVLDFGIATFVDRDRRAGLTGEGTIGTPIYMSPEALLGRAITPATDVYSVGVTAYVMLGGDPPHGPPAESPYEQAIRQVHQLPTSLAQLRPDLPAEVVQIVMATLAREPEHRPTLVELREVLAHWAERFEEPVWPLSRADAAAMAGPPSADDTTVNFVGVAPSRDAAAPRDRSGVEARAPAPPDATELLSEGTRRRDNG